MRTLLTSGLSSQSQRRLLTDGLGPKLISLIAFGSLITWRITESPIRLSTESNRISLVVKSSAIRLGVQSEHTPSRVVQVSVRASHIKLKITGG